MAASEELGIKGIHNFHFFVEKPERSFDFYTRGFGWNEVAKSSAEMEERSGQQSKVYAAGDIDVLVSTPQSESCRAARYLRRHPAGVGSISFEVEDIDRAFKFLVEREATPIHKVEEVRDSQGGRFQHFSITTALGDVSFRFIQKTDWEGFAPGFEGLNGTSRGESNDFSFSHIDHITCNAQTMAPMKLWLEHVLGMEQCWDIEFHTEDINKDATTGTGLRSVVMWDPRSGIKFPINEPLQPFFKEGQINKFVEDNWGAGVQHIALLVDDVCEAVKTLRERNIQFLNTPGVYYDAAPERLASQGVSVDNIDHSMDRLRELGILIDGSPVDNYLVQIFLKDAMTMYNEPKAGPFFFELIERCGDNGFGGGNFRALFEAIERDQQDDN